MLKSILKKRPRDDSNANRPAKRPKKTKRQREYHSSSSDEDEDESTDFKPVLLADSDDEAASNGQATTKRTEKAPAASLNDDDVAAQDSDAASSNDSETSSRSAASSTAPHKKRKRNDPAAFATSISKILSSKLSASKRLDPVLSRSHSTATAAQDRADFKLEERARRKIREDKKAASERGRVRDVLGTGAEGGGDDKQSAEGVQELERRLRKTAQRGVVKLFNAVRAAQVKGEEAAREAREKGVVGMGKREEKVNEMSKQGFLDLIAGGGKKAVEG